MKLEQYLQNFTDDQVCTVNGNKVWDYKEFENFSEIRLISEPVEGSDSYEGIVAMELRQFAGIFVDVAEVIDETTGESVKSI